MSSEKDLLVKRIGGVETLKNEIPPKTMRHAHQF